MRRYIKKLRSKSETTRKQILLLSLVVCMAIVFFIWISTLGSHFNNKKNVTAVNKEEVAKPFALFGQTIKDTYNNVTASVGNISKTINKEKVIDLIPVEHTNQ